MKFVLFYHSLVSDWNHGNAHFLRGLCRELIRRGHAVEVLEPSDGWSAANLRAEYGEAPFEDFKKRFPELRFTLYGRTPDLDRILHGADVVIVHEWNDPALVTAIGEHRRHADYLLLFHDTHHRSVTAAHQMSLYDLTDYDAVLGFGAAVCREYRRRGWAERVFVWHEAADTTLFRPLPGTPPEGDVVWIGNWGDGERRQSIEEFLIGPVSRLGLRAAVYGVRYPDDALTALRRAGIEYRGWLPNFRVPETFARFKMTVHIPRAPYSAQLRGIPTIRPFEALACGIPLLTTGWSDEEGLFRTGRDLLCVENGNDAEQAMIALLQSSERRSLMAASGRETILARHTCAHRADELLAICAELSAGRRGRTGDLPLYQEAAG